jgi:hypothetical protein
MSVSHGTEVCPYCLQTKLDEIDEDAQDTRLALTVVTEYLDYLATVVGVAMRPRLDIIRDLLSDDEDEE